MENLPGESPWTEDPGGLQFMGLQSVRHDWVTKYILIFIEVYNFCATVHQQESYAFGFSFSSLFKNVPWLHCQRKCILLDYRQSSLVTCYLLLRHNSVIYVDIYSLAMALIPDHVLIQFHSRKKIKKWTSLSFTLSFNPSWALFNMPRLEIQEETDWSIPACCNHRL